MASSNPLTRYVRYAQDGETHNGILEGGAIRRIEGGLFGARTPTGETVSLGDVKLRYPVDPPKIICVGLNYASHIGDRPAPAKPEIFYKPGTALQDPGGPIVIPRGSKDLHFEAELVAVMGEGGSIFGYTCGNDVSERNWQHGSQGDKKDVQWWRAKGSDTFGPLGPAIVTGLDYASSRITGRLNGDVVQTQMLSDLIFKPEDIVEFVGEYVTLEPGDVIYTGTPGKTVAMKPGDRVEVEIEGIGVLENPVVAKS